MATAPQDIIRNVPFEVTRSEEDGDGLTLEGYAAVFDSPTEINSWEGRFIETVERGAFSKSISEKTPVLMFNHGQHPMIGDMPIGAISHLREDNRGLFVRARLASNWLVEPIREAISQGSISGMSFRMRVIKDSWENPSAGGDMQRRRLQEVSCPELGPVVFPAYLDTEVGVRSQQVLDLLRDPDVRADLARAVLVAGVDTDQFADPGFIDEAKFPIGAPAQVETAWAFVLDDENVADYTLTQINEMKARIQAAATKFDVNLDEVPFEGDLLDDATPDEAASGTSDEAGSTPSEPPRHSPSVGSAVRRLERQLTARKLGVFNA